jgi:hypothetical protein
MRIAILIGGVALAVIIIAGIQYGPGWFAESEPPPAVFEEPEVIREPAPAPLLPPPPEVPPPIPKPIVELPELDASDPFVLERVGAFGLPPLWLDREDLIRRLAVVIDNAPRGEYPRRQLGFLAPTGRFQVVERGDRLFVDAASYARYDIYLDLLERIEPQTLADTLLLIKPLVSEGLTELGNQQSMTTQIHVAISRITELPELREEVELVQPKVFYQYADAELEALSPLQKQVLRMGPANVHRLKVYLRALQIALAANDPADDTPG